MAVPCWSSWKTGISTSCFKRASISKHLGAEISSRLIPPKTGVINFTVFTISSTSLVFKAIGKESTPAKFFKSTLLPSITGKLAEAPIFPSPSTAEPSVTTPTVFPLIV